MARVNAIFNDVHDDRKPSYTPAYRALAQTDEFGNTWNRRFLGAEEYREALKQTGEWGKAPYTDVQWAHTWNNEFRQLCPQDWAVQDALEHSAADLERARTALEAEPEDAGLQERAEDAQRVYDRAEALARPALLRSWAYYQAA